MGVRCRPSTKTCTVPVERFETVARAQVPKPREVLTEPCLQQPLKIRMLTLDSVTDSKGQLQAEPQDKMTLWLMAARHPGFGPR